MGLSENDIYGAGHCPGAFIWQTIVFQLAVWRQLGTEKHGNLGERTGESRPQR